MIDANLIPGLINILRNDKYEVTKEALWAVCNAISGGTDKQVSYLVHQGVIAQLCGFLNNYRYKKSLLIAMEGITKILEIGKKLSKDGINQYAEYVEESGGVDYLERIQSDVSVPDNIYEKAAQIVMDYFDGEVMENDEDIIDIE